MKILKRLSVMLLAFTLAFAAIACAAAEVDMGIGDANVENDGVRLKYKMPGKLTDNYKLECTLTAESEADLNDEFIISIATDKRTANVYSEKVLFSIPGELIKQHNNKLALSVDMGKLSDLLPEDKDAFYINFKRKDADKWDYTKWSDMKFNYAWKGDKVVIKSE